MILQELFSMLTTGPFANTALSGINGELKEAHYPKVVNSINLGIIELYKRFKFLENELTLRITPLTKNYYLKPNRVVTINGVTENEYIDVPTNTNGFLNIVKVTAMFNSSGEEIKVNTTNKYYNTLPTVIELAPDILQITNIVADEAISVLYQAYPTKLTVDDCDYADTYELQISDIVLDPLISYIAAKTFKPMGANDSTANADKSASYSQEYELACQKLMLYGLNVSDHTERDTFVDKGWV